MTAASDARDGMRGGPGDGWGGYGGWHSYRCGMAMGWRPVELLAMILGFIVFWPIGVAVLAWKIWQKRSAYQGDFATFAEQKWRAARDSVPRRSMQCLGRG
jgi:hypothetical protein